MRYRLAGLAILVTMPTLAEAQQLRLARGSWRLARAEARLTVDNLLGVAWNEAQFATLSRLPGEPLVGVEELHFTPGSPRAVQLAVAYRF